MEMVDTGQITEVAKGIGDVGMMAMVSAFFLVLAAIMMVALFKWFKKMIDGMISENSAVIKELLAETRNQNSMLSDISEALKPETILRIKNLSKVEFDMSCAEIKILVWKVKTQNHLSDKIAIDKKVETLLRNIYDDRSSRLDYYKWNGKPLSRYCNDKWVGWVKEAMMVEVYREPFSEFSVDANIEAVYARIKIDFYHNLDNK